MKLDYSLAPPEFDDVIQVLQHSAETGKYGRNDWLNGKNYDPEQSLSSIKRHLRDYREGIREDADNQLHPMLMVACRALMQYTLDKRANGIGSVSVGTEIEVKVDETATDDIESYSRTCLKHTLKSMGYKCNKNGTWKKVPTIAEKVDKNLKKAGKEFIEVWKGIEDND